MTMQPTKSEPASQEFAQNEQTREEKVNTKEGFLENTARKLAATHQEISVKKSKQSLSQRLPTLSEWLRQAHARFATHSADEPRLSYAGEWMLDNFYVIDRALRQVTEDLPDTYERQLPKLMDETAQVGHVSVQNLPRVYALAHAYLIHEKQHIEPDRLERFIIAYQAVTPLTMGEVWALPIMLRLALIESLALATGQLVNLFEQPPAFAVPSHSITNWTQNKDTREDLASIDETRIADKNALADEEVVAYAIPSLRTLDGQNWLEFFEDVSLVHRTLSSGPAGIYANMDFATRNQYRNVVEKLSRSTHIDETIVAQEAVELAFRAAQRNGVINGVSSHVADSSKISTPSNFLQTLPRDSHIGYYLVDEGSARLEEAINYKPKGMEWVRRWLLNYPTALYLGGVALLTLLLMAGALWYGVASGAGVLMIGLIILLTAIPTSTIAINILNSVLTRLLTPRMLPKLDFTKGVPSSCRTMVVVPALISSLADIDSLADQLELHYLRSTDGMLTDDISTDDISTGDGFSNEHYIKYTPSHITFALLSDFSDGPQEEMPEDDELVAAATAAIDALNAKYVGTPFYLFHRHRLWNESEGVWMGWERKRGKLNEFNRLLRGDETTTYTTQVGELTILPDVRYVITLDADTVLPRGEAQRLIGTMAHPLNRAHFDAEGKVDAGYTILQPRTEIQATNRPKSLFARVFGGDTGFDLYTLAVSDIYQDLFGEGIFVGKGIYEVDSFERSLEGRIPENSILSHDLFEGIHGRAGLVTDVVLYEDYPPHYLVSVLRSHRWVRGDWQLLPWLFPNVPIEDESHSVKSHSVKPHSVKELPNELAPIDRWKIFDNLRRSLLSPLLLAFFVAGWTILPGSAWVWTLLAVLAPSTGLITAAVNGLVGFIQGNDPQVIRLDIRNHAIRWLLFIAFLPYESFLLVDAIVTTLVRLYIRRRRLLQWVTAERTVRLFGDEISVASTVGKMMPSLFVVVALTLLVLWVNPTTLIVAGPFLAVWLLAWWIAHAISKPEEHETKPLSAEQRQSMRVLARRTWLFYEHFVGPDDNWLPPDHFQEEPRGVVAHRTSPTNTGMYLLSALAAYDFGYIGAMNLAARLQSTFETLARLDRYRGHFLNWIDTRSLVALPPRYVSTVDSGNLAGVLIALKEGCLEVSHTPILYWERWQGILDLFPPLVDAATNVTGQVDNPLADYLKEVKGQIAAVQDEPLLWVALLQQLAENMRPTINQQLMATLERKTQGNSVKSNSATTSNEEIVDAEVLQSCRIFVDRIHHHLDDMRRDVATLLPWLDLFVQPPTLFSDAETQPELHQLWKELQEMLPATALLTEIAHPKLGIKETTAYLQSALMLISKENIAENQEEVTNAQKWLQVLENKVAESKNAAQTLETSFQKLANDADDFVTDMDFGFLFNKLRHVFHIGYNIDSGKLDGNYYDLVASEARIASLVAIAKRDVPQSHWLHLGRPLTQLNNGERVLLSWSGTMFEYLMPPLLLRGYRETLLDQSCRASVERQIEVGRQYKTPWGISESGFYTFDAAMNYQYRAFGAPGLGFKRGLEDDQVIAPYASMLAVSYRPQAVWQNFQELQKLNMMGRYGLYEAIDFTTSRLGLGQDHAIVQSYMAHHQGMILLALLNYLQKGRMVNRFHADPRIQSVELLLQEGVPAHAPLQFPHTKEEAQTVVEAPQVPINPWSVPVDTPMPLVHYLSNGQYGVLITNAGGGYSRWQDVQLTRWRADTTLDDWGSWLYLQEIAQNPERGALNNHAANQSSNQTDITKNLWSATRQPTGIRPQYEDVLFHPHMAEFRRRDYDITLLTQITIAPGENVEIRRIHITNEKDRPRRLRLTSYGEVVLGASGGDDRHQAFAKLFVESEYVEATNTLLFRRRPRAADEQAHFMAHSLVVASDQKLTCAAESDRARFLGRGHTDRHPHALSTRPTEHAWLSGTTGATLDPIMALGQEIELEPHATTQVVLLTIASNTREEALMLAERYQSWGVLDRALQSARSMAQAELRELDLVESRLEPVQKLLSLLLYPHPARRAAEETLRSNRKSQSGLWAYGISGDFPILLLRIHDESEGDLLQEILRAHRYWRRRGLQIDVVILNRQGTNYGQPVESFIQRMISRMESSQSLNQRGGIFLLRSDQLNETDRVLLQTTARVILNGAAGDLRAQLEGFLAQPSRLPVFEPTIEYAAVGAEENPAEASPQIERPTDLQFDNGFGGFSSDGREYIIYQRPNEYLQPDKTLTKITSESTPESTPKTTPLPWINVIANPDFGTLISETGGGYTWAINSGENRLTSWRNDPVVDQPAEVIYLRDEQTADLWTPTPQPTPADVPYLVRHGAGYSTFEHISHGLKQTMQIFVAPDAPVKIVRLRLENATEQPRRITATYYAEWTLGVDRSQSGQFIVSEYEEAVNALLAQNTYSGDFGGRVAFVAGSHEPHGLTTDRTEFVGRLGNLAAPDALQRIGLSGRVQAGLDPCAAVQLHINIAPHDMTEVYFLVGQGEDRENAIALIERFQQENAVEQTWQAARQNWDEILGTISVETPDPAMNLLLNRWLLYQALSCRLWGRSALYQSSGAYGFRDQLQDSMALIHAKPDLVRSQILRAARHQFEEGDVLHWWHPPGGQGVRTRITDDLLWLPYVTAHYVAATGDESVLQEEVSFLRGEPLAQDEEERYAQFESTEELFSIYEHCLRAIQKGTTSGIHGIPLMGAGDWNDGMNRVGIEGKGESIWLGWFLHATLTQFATLCDRQNEGAEADRLRRKATDIVRSAEENGWDGDWYRRAYYDDGTPLGSAQSRECRIDSIAQSWSVISGAADAERAQRAMQSVLDRLVRWEDRLILLFTPPFDKTNQDPGYIKGYLPGIRENGGQYTHAALWAIWAFAELGDGDTAHRLFELINPILRADSPEKAVRYKVEPYVISADVYGVEPHIGRGGWTWYTGSSGWMYRLGIEAILGIRRVAGGLRIDPQLPSDWPGFEATYRFEGATYYIRVERETETDTESGANEGSRPLQMWMDYNDIPDGIVPLYADGQEHHVYIKI